MWTRRFNVQGLWRGLITLGSLALLSCGGAAVISSDHYYRLVTEPDIKVAQSPKLDGILAVRRFATDGPHSGRAIVYSRAEEPMELYSYRYHFWTEPPARLVQGQLVQFLRQAGVARSSYRQDPALRAEFIMAGRLQRFEIVRSPTDPTAVVAMEVSLQKRGDAQPFMVQAYAAEVAVQGGSSVRVGVTALAQALMQVQRALIKDIKGLIRP